MPRRILVIGAHPDDAEFKVGGTATQWRRLGHDVTFVSLTNGAAGHHWMPESVLIERRRREAEAAAAVIDARSVVLDLPDGALEPTLANRLKVVELIRRFEPDLVLTHRLNDYHPDHRYTAQLVMDSAYMITVPKVAPAYPHLRHHPVFGYVSDAFTRPSPFTPEVVVDIESDLDRVVSMLHCHKSQVYEWLPYNQGAEDQVPPDETGRKEFLRHWYLERMELLLQGMRPALVQRLGEERAGHLRVIEAFEISEYGAPLDAALRRDLFPFEVTASAPGVEQP